MSRRRVPPSAMLISNTCLIHDLYPFELDVNDFSNTELDYNSLSIYVRTAPPSRAYNNGLKEFTIIEIVA